MATDAVTASIVIPTRNRPGLLVQAVASALAALPEGAEIIVTDDRSDPPATDVLAPLAHPALRVTVNEGRNSAGANRNHGVRVARGAVIFFLDDDDLLLPRYPAAVLGHLARDKAHVWGFSATTRHEGGALPERFPESYGDLQPTHDRPLRKRLAGLGCGFWITREAFLAAGGIDEDLTVNEDTEFSLRLLSAGHEPLRSPQPGVSLLLHGAGQITKSTASGERARCFRVILDRHGEFLAADRKGHRHLLRRFIKMQGKAGHLSAALRTALTEGRVMDRPATLAHAFGNWAMYRFRR